MKPRDAPPDRERGPGGAKPSPLEVELESCPFGRDVELDGPHHTPGSKRLVEKLALGHEALAVTLEAAQSHAGQGRHLHEDTFGPLEPEGEAAGLALRSSSRRLRLESTATERKTPSRPE